MKQTIIFLVIVLIIISSQCSNACDISNCKSCYSYGCIQCDPQYTLSSYGYSCYDTRLSTGTIIFFVIVSVFVLIFLIIFLYVVFKACSKETVPIQNRGQALQIQDWKINENIGQNNQPCSICLELEYLDIQLQCSHFFHKKCIGAWLQKSPLCPQCRRQIKKGKKICKTCNILYRQISIKEDRSPQICPNCMGDNRQIPRLQSLQSMEHIRG